MKQISMKQTVVVLAVASAAGIALGLIGSRVLSAQETSPTKNKGVTAQRCVRARRCRPSWQYWERPLSS